MTLYTVIRNKTEDLLQPGLHVTWINVSFRSVVVWPAIGVKL